MPRMIGTVISQLLRTKRTNPFPVRRAPVSLAQIRAQDLCRAVLIPRTYRGRPIYNFDDCIGCGSVRQGLSVGGHRTVPGAHQ